MIVFWNSCCEGRIFSSLNLLNGIVSLSLSGGIAFQKLTGPNIIFRMS